MKILLNIIHPFRAIEKLRWKCTKKKMKSCGYGVTAKWCFAVLAPEYIQMGDNIHIGHHCEINAFASYNRKSTGAEPQLEIRDDVVIADYSYISCMNKVVIGKGTLLGANTFITDNYHGQSSSVEMGFPPDQRKLYSKGPVVLGQNVWTGRNVCIMPGVTIGDGAVIGANAVVTHDIPAMSIAGGIPAKVIRMVSTNDSET